MSAAVRLAAAMPRSSAIAACRDAAPGASACKPRPACDPHPDVTSAVRAPRGLLGNWGSWNLLVPRSAFVGFLGPLRAFAGVFGTSGGLLVPLGASWGLLGPFGCFGTSWCLLLPFGASPASLCAWPAHPIDPSSKTTLGMCFFLIRAPHPLQPPLKRTTRNNNKSQHHGSGPQGHHFRLPREISIPYDLFVSPETQLGWAQESKAGLSA